MSYIRPGDNIDLFTKHASLEAIRHQLKNARAMQARWTRLSERLFDLLVDRESQIEAGQWPPRVKKDSSDE